MATIQSVRAEKQKFEDHVERHRCRIGQCDNRRQLWLNYQREGEIWGGYKTESIDTRGML